MQRQIDPKAQRHDVTSQVYEYYITVDVEGVGQELLSIPLKADCQVPAVELESKDLAYGECFVRFHEPRTLVLVNTSEELIGLFRVVPQAASTYSVARVSPEPEEGQVTALVPNYGPYRI